MKEEELGELLGQLQEAEAFITSFVVGLPLAPAAATAAEAAGAGCDASPNSGGASTGAGLELVGQGVELDPRAVAAAAAAAGWAPGEMPAEVVALSAAAAGQHTQLIAAYRGGQGSGGVAEQEAPGSALALDALAEAELHASADSGALSLLLGGAGGTRLQSGALQQLLARVPAGPGGGSRLTAEAVARCLGLQHSTTVAALERAFAGAGSAGDSLAATIQPRLPAEEGGTQGGASHAADGIFASSAPTFSATQVEAGLACLLSQLLASTSGGGSSGSAFATASPPASPPPQPTGKQYWRSRVEAALPGDVLRAWELLEAQASRQFATLQGRSGAAQEVRGGGDWVVFGWRPGDGVMCTCVGYAVASHGAHAYKGPTWREVASASAGAGTACGERAAQVHAGGAAEQPPQPGAAAAAHPPATLGAERDWKATAARRGH